MKLTSLVTQIPKVGPKYKTLLEKLEIKTIEDLIYHFPFRYDDYSQTKEIGELQEGDTVTITANLEKIDNIYTKNGKRLTRAKTNNSSGMLEIIWFNQHYIKKQFKIGEEYRFSGKIGLFNKKPALISPEFEPSNLNTHLNTGRLVPIYPETAGVSSKWLRTRINDVLNALDTSKQLPEFLPPKILEKYSLENFSASLNSFHFPKSKMEPIHAKKRFAFEELFLELLKVEKRKAEWCTNHKTRTHRLTAQTQKATETLIETLPFKLTSSQNSAIKEILENMCGKHPMNRLLEGDVGTGKTIVAVMAAYFACLNGYKTLYMAPTEILANQHYQTFQTFLGNFGIKIGLKTGTTKTKEPKTDILIGTHALLYTKKPLENVGLVVIDEQHRFGVEQRAQLSNVEIPPHILTMTATPIPRTLALTLYGDLDISILKETPNKDKKITTRIIPEKLRDQAYKWIKNKGESTFIVCPFIEESETESLENIKAATAEYEKLAAGVFKGVKIGLLHGRLKSKEKQEIVEKFRSGEIKVLVSTPVIEVGIDVPEATIMVIESGERYGLASLHQLRGRVGRGNKSGFCLVFMSTWSKKGFARLKSLERVSNGLELAEIDMKYRGQGDLYGTMQHGFKRFKVANPYDIKLLEATKKEAETYFPSLDEYPLLKEKLERRASDLVANN